MYLSIHPSEPSLGATAGRALHTALPAPKHGRQPQATSIGKAPSLGAQGLDGGRERARKRGAGRLWCPSLGWRRHPRGAPQAQGKVTQGSGLWDGADPETLLWDGADPEALSRQPAPSGGRGSCGEQGSGGRSLEVAKVSVGRGTGCSREGDRAPPRTEPKGRRAAWHFPDPQASPPPSPPQPPVRTRSALSAARVTL